MTASAGRRGIISLLRSEMQSENLVADLEEEADLYELAASELAKLGQARLARDSMIKSKERRKMIETLKKNE